MNEDGLAHLPPLRTCLGCRTKKEKGTMLRIVRDGNGRILPDDKGILPGRGAYICKDPECMRKAVKHRAFARAFRASVSDEDLLPLEGYFSDICNKENRC